MQLTKNSKILQDHADYHGYDHGSPASHLHTENKCSKEHKAYRWTLSSVHFRTKKKFFPKDM